jgi:hypothetical protein
VGSGLLDGSGLNRGSWVCGSGEFYDRIKSTAWPSLASPHPEEFPRPRAGVFLVLIKRVDNVLVDVAVAFIELTSVL